MIITIIMGLKERQHRLAILCGFQRKEGREGEETEEDIDYCLQLRFPIEAKLFVTESESN